MLEAKDKPQVWHKYTSHIRCERKAQPESREIAM